MTEAPVCNPVAFRLEARWQRVCAACGKARVFHAHHVVDMNTLRREAGKKGNELYDPRNALRLCQALGDVNCRCHFQHESGMHRVKTTELRDENIEYAFEVLHAYAFDYLRAQYDDSEHDPRLDVHLAKET